MHGHVVADDWGLSSAINDGILELAKIGVINGVSILVDGQAAAYKTPELASIQNLSLGLHFNLTFESLFKSPKEATMRLLFSTPKARTILLEKIKSEFERQATALKSMIGRIDHLDGHEHLHVAPFVWNAIEPLAKRFGIKRVRSPLDWSLVFSSRAPLVPFALFFHRRLDRSYWSTQRFAYPLAKSFESPEAFRTYLERHRDCEVIVHPGRAEGKPSFSDSMRESRVKEFEILRALK